MPVAIAIHGGAGALPRREMTRARADAYRQDLDEALSRGYGHLQRGAPALDAAIAAVVAMEDSPLFNAGRGAVYNAEGRHELDAAVMDGATLRAGAVTCVSHIRNPVLAARAVMEHSRHVLLAGVGAERFASRHGVARVSPEYFHTAERLAALKRNLRGHHGTVGAVALDRQGNLAAATSTGGYTGKLPGRVGDSPLVGAGTYADNRACAVSGTGLGEAFIRALVAYDVAARMRYRGNSLAAAARAALSNVARLGGDGGLVAVDRRGNVAMPFNSEGMYRASIDRSGKRTIAIY
ncbi:MAG TPA: isoaspartyl peptidase/L-asparaginase [Burkholderiales bacterium]|nr:isoaspartyl peptidase/L-asparaginase [Burkholderiales bacterium]